MNISKTKVILAFATVYVIWGSTYLAIRYAVETIPPFFMMGVRSVIAGGVLYFWSIKKGNRVRRQELPSLIILGILFFLLGHGLLAWAQTFVASGIAAVLIASDPLWIALIESVMMKDVHLGRKQIVGLIFGLAGVGLLFLPASGANALHMNSLGAFVILLSAIAWSIGAVYSRAATLPKSSALAAGLELIIGGLLLCGVAVFLGEFDHLHLSSISARSIIALLYLIVLGSIVTFTAYVWLLTVTTATRVATHTYVNPVIAVLLGWAFAGERFTILAIAASSIIVFSVYLMLESKQPEAERV